VELVAFAPHMHGSGFLRVAAMEARLELMSSCQRPTRGKDVRRLCRALGSGRGNLRVAAGGGESQLCELRLVVGNGSE